MRKAEASYVLITEGSVDLSICESDGPSDRRSIVLSTYRSIHPSIQSLTHPSIRPSFCSFVRPSVHHFVRRSVCPSITVIKMRNRVYNSTLAHPCASSDASLGYLFSFQLISSPEKPEATESVGLVALRTCNKCLISLNDD